MSDDLIERLRTWAKEWPHWKFTEHQHAALLAVFDALAAKDTALSEMRVELERVKAALEPFSRKERWFKTYHRPEVPGPELPVVFFSDNPWESNDLEPWVAAARALAPSIQDETDLGARE